MNIKIKSIYTNDMEIPNTLRKELKDIEDYQIITITESYLSDHKFHYTIFYKGDNT